MRVAKRLVLSPSSSHILLCDHDPRGRAAMSGGEGQRVAMAPAGLAGAGVRVVSRCEAGAQRVSPARPMPEAMTRTLRNLVCPGAVHAANGQNAWTDWDWSGGMTRSSK